MNHLIENFHFIRPEWLWALIPVALLLFALKQGKLAQQQDNWSRYIDAHLLAHLSIKGEQKTASRQLPVLISLAAAALVAALAGPSWQKAEVPSYSGGEPVIAVLSLAQSMNADDLAPSRLKRATHKLRDILQRTQGDERGLVIYSDTPFVASPLTTDAQVIEQMLPELSTTLMPVLGNRLDLAIEKASGLLSRAGASSGQIILLTDSTGDKPEASLQAAQAAFKAGYAVSVLGAGTEAGATLQTANGRAISRQNGETILTKLPTAELQQLAKVGGGVMTTITADEADLDRILPKRSQSLVAAGKAQDFKADAWVDMGYWLLLIPVALSALLFRRGVIFGLAFVLAGTLMQSEPVYAAENVTPAVVPTEQAVQVGNPVGSVTPANHSSVWTDLWKTPDQQGSEAFGKGEFTQASQAFKDSNWKAAADYRSGNFSAAASEYASINTPLKDYNLGNALAKSGEFEAALNAYDAFLKQEPEHQNAKFNRDLVAKLLEQQKKEEEQKKEEQKQQQDQQQNQSGDKQDQQNQAGEQQDDQQKQDQSGGEQKDQQQAQSGEQQDDQQQQSQSGSEQDKQQQAQSGEQQEDSGEQQDQQANPSNEQAQAGQQVEKPEDKGLLSSLLSEILEGNKGEQPEAEASVPGIPPQQTQQAVEQQLRKVPDDPSGLLRARIRQHYLRLQAAQ